MTQRFTAQYTMSETGYLTNTVMAATDDDRPMRYDWTGEGNGAGVLNVMGTEHYIATWVNVVQHNPVFRYATRAVGIDQGQLDIGVIT